ncbi:hypothetical protein PHMEG_00018894, partial [Phytophthora megakarya]
PMKIQTTAIMSNPKRSLAIDAPPIAPYDDGFSTDSEDFTASDEQPFHSPVYSLYAHGSNAVGSEEVAENQLKIQQQQTRTGPQENDIKQELEAKSETNVVVSIKNEENASNQGAGGHKIVTNGQIQARDTNQVTPGATKEEHCRNCQGYLTPLVERLKMMKTAASQQVGKTPPPSRQCSCCHITYPFSALTDESRKESCVQPRCYMCNWAVKAAKNNGVVEVTGVKRMVDGTVKDVEPRGDCCRSCRGKLLPLSQRLEMMKQAVLDHKGSGPPPSRQCSCCHITQPVSRFGWKSREPACSAPICQICETPSTINVKVAEGSRIGAVKLNDKGSEENAFSSTVVATNDETKEKLETLPKTEKALETIVIESSGDEEGEVADDNICKCCSGQLIPLAKRLQLVKDAARLHGGKTPPPSRQCACCRISYPPAGLTRKSRKLTRVVPICQNCCMAGGSAIYEMLAASDEFFEAFKIEDPVMAQNLLTKKTNGSLMDAVKKQKTNMTKRMNAAQLAQRMHQLIKTRSQLGQPRYLMARKSCPATRLIIGNPAKRNLAPHVQSGAERQSTAQEATNLQAPRSRTARWLKQFELVDGKTVRERRLEARNRAKERQLEKIRQQAAQR